MMNLRTTAAALAAFFRGKENAKSTVSAQPATSPAPDPSWAPEPRAFGVNTGGHVVALYTDTDRKRAFLYDTREFEPPRPTFRAVSIMPGGAR